MSQHLSLIAVVRRLAVHANPVRVIRGLVIACFALLCGVAFAQSAMTDRSFDHATTGFSLSNQHITARCESCHVQGVFRGTPRECSACHRNASRPNATQFPLQHIPSTQQCDICHKSVDWGIVMFRHQGVTKGSCLTCHNGAFTSQNAIGKPAQHLITTASCDNCHNTLTWTATTYNHAGVVLGTCASCHNGFKATGKRANHIPTTLSCDACHTTSTWMTKFNHNGVVPGSCETCHNRITTIGKDRSHIPTSAACDNCHKNYIAFKPAAMNHTGLDGQCTTCHSGAYLGQNAQTKTANHVATTAQCDTCHKSTMTWATAMINHANFSPPVVIGDHTCANCHKAGGPGLSMPGTHIPTTVACDVCHTDFGGFRTVTMSHAGTAGQCSNCHNGTNATGKPKVGHVTTTAQCDTCHSTYRWTPATFAHDASTARRCSVCHNGTAAMGMNSGTHIPDFRECDTCHTTAVTPLSFTNRTMNHTGLAGKCATCHNGAYISQNAQAKSASHTVTTAQCDTCHSSTLTWATATIDHSKFSPPVTMGDHTCANCHKLGGTGLPKPTNHIPTSGACDTCHKSFGSFTQATMSHDGTAGLCNNCHNGSYTSANAQAKPQSTHIPTMDSCDVCHLTTTTWQSLKTPYAHTGIAPGTCQSCHIASYAKMTYKPANHIPTTALCDVCHRTTAWLPLITPYSHTGIATGTCTTCHVSTYSNIVVKAASHIPTLLSCDLCHKSYSTFTQFTMNHTGTNGACNTCHNGSFTGVNAQAKPTGHVPTTASCDLCHSTTAWKPAANHTSASVGQCAFCHNGSTAKGMDANHIPTTLVSASWASCDACHKSTTTFIGVRLHATVFTSNSQYPGTCAKCHEWGNPYGLTGRIPGDHPPSKPERLAPNSCDGSRCHSVRGF